MWKKPFVFILLSLLMIVSNCSKFSLRKGGLSTDLDVSLARSLPSKQVQLLVTFANGKSTFESANDLSLQTYLGANTYTVKTTVGEIAKIQKDANVQWVGQYKAEHKFIEKYLDAQPHLEASYTKSKKRDVQAYDELRKNHNIKSKLPAKSDWRFSFVQRNEKMVALNVVLEDHPSHRSVTKMQQVESVMSNVMSTFKSRGILASKNLAASAKKFVVVVPESQLAKAAAEIAQHPDVHWVEPKAATETFNNWARWITHSGAANVDPISPVLDGANEIVGIGDSGLDFNNCYFYDEKNAVPFTETVDKPKKTSAHRKIHEYWGLVDKIAEDGAHGTHVSGSVAGQSSSIVTNKAQFDQHRGMAPNAKILFTDIGCTNEDGCECHGVPCACDLSWTGYCEPDDRAVYPPLDLNEGLFPYSYESGSRIMTNSWGGGAGFGYGSSAMEIDQFAWDHKDFLILFAAGNAGDMLGYSSLGIEAEAKNGLTVGASMNNVEMFRYMINNVVDYDYRAKYFSEVISSELQCDFSYCQNFTSDFDAVCKFLANFTTEEQCCSQKGLCEPSFFSPCGCGFSGAGGYCCKDCAVRAYSSSAAAEVFSHENAAYFTSFGPTTDLRIKPDVVAPGYSIISAKAHDTVKTPRVCSANQQFDSKKDVMSMGGTSMSTPVTAGNAALVRQYFLEGYHHDGRKNTTAGFVPSAALIKSTLINSGRPLKGTIDLFDVPIPIHPKEGETSPILLNAEMVEGFGRVTLADTLYFADNSDTKNQLLVARANNVREGGVLADFGDPLIGDNQAHEYCLFVGAQTGGARVKATLVWTDYPSSPARQTHLVNDLDLVVRDANGDLFVGNAKENSMARDSTNNVEQVTISSAAQGNYMIRVEAAHIFKQQPYALVISGRNIRFRTCDASEQFYSDSPSSPTGTATSMYNTYFFLSFGMIFILTIAVGILSVVSYMLYKKTKEYGSNGIQLRDDVEMNATQ